MLFHAQQQPKITCRHHNYVQQDCKEIHQSKSLFLQYNCINYWAGPVCSTDWSKRSKNIPQGRVHFLDTLGAKDTSGRTLSQISFLHLQLPFKTAIISQAFISPRYIFFFLLSAANREPQITLGRARVSQTNNDGLSLCSVSWLSAVPNKYSLVPTCARSSIRGFYGPRQRLLPN